MNGCVERFMRTLGDSLRANPSGVDKKLYCYEAQYISWTWNRTPRATYSRAQEYNGLTPFEARRLRTKGPLSGVVDVEDAKRWDPIKRRFGCLAYILIQPREKVTKLHPKWRKAVFLGYCSKNSSWVFGCYSEDNRTRKGSRWTEYETRDAKFLEDYLVSDISSLRPGTGGVMISGDALSNLSGHTGVGKVALGLAEPSS